MTETTVCASGVERLMDYLEGLLPEATVAALERHVGSCDRCQAFLGSYRATPAILRDATDAALPRAVETTLIAWLREQR